MLVLNGMIHWKCETVFRITAWCNYIFHMVQHHVNICQVTIYIVYDTKQRLHIIYALFIMHFNMWYICIVYQILYSDFCTFFRLKMSFQQNWSEKYIKIPRSCSHYLSSITRSSEQAPLHGRLFWTPHNTAYMNKKTIFTRYNDSFEHFIASLQHYMA